MTFSFSFYLSNKVRNLSLLPSYSNIFRIMKNFINKYIYTILYWWKNFSFRWATKFRYWGTERHLDEQLLKKLTGVYCSIYCGGLWNILLIQYLVVSSSLELLFERFSKKHFHYQEYRRLTPIWQRNSAVSSFVNSHQYTFTNNIRS